MQRNRGKQQSAEDNRSLKENWKYQGNIHIRMGTIKDRNSKGTIKQKRIRSGDEYTEELYKKRLNDQDNHDDVVTHLESGILECEVKRALGSIVQTKLVKVMEFELSNLKPLKIMLLKCCSLNARKFGKLSSSHQTQKGQFHSNPKEEQCQRMFNRLHTCTHFTC